MSRKSKYDGAAAGEATAVDTPFTTDGAAKEDDGTYARENGADANGNSKRLTPAQERQRQERLARRPRYWIMRLTGNGLPDSVVAILPSRATAERKMYEYASVLRASPDSLCVFRVSTPDGYRYPE